MNGILEVEGNLYHALDHFLGQMGKFSVDHSAIKKLIFTSNGKKNQKKRFAATMILEITFISCGWMRPLVIPADIFSMRTTHFIRLR